MIGILMLYVAVIALPATYMYVGSEYTVKKSIITAIIWVTVSMMIISYFVLATYFIQEWVSEIS